jgi:hypothetical protein
MLPGHEEAVDDALDAMVRSARTGHAAIVRAVDER